MPLLVDQGSQAFLPDGRYLLVFLIGNLNRGPQVWLGCKAQWFVLQMMGLVSPCDWTLVPKAYKLSGAVWF